MVVVRSHHNHGVCLSRQFADNVRLLQSFDRLLSEFVARASRRFEKTFQGGLPLSVVSLVTLQPLLKHLTVNHAKVQLRRDRHRTGY